MLSVLETLIFDPYTHFKGPKRKKSPENQKQRHCQILSLWDAPLSRLWGWSGGEVGEFGQNRRACSHAHVDSGETHTAGQRRSCSKCWHEKDVKWHEMLDRSIWVPYRWDSYSDSIEGECGKEPLNGTREILIPEMTVTARGLIEGTLQATEQKTCLPTLDLLLLSWVTLEISLSFPEA